MKTYKLVGTALVLSIVACSKNDVMYSSGLVSQPLMDPVVVTISSAPVVPNTELQVGAIDSVSDNEATPPTAKILPEEKAVLEQKTQPQTSKPKGTDVPSSEDLKACCGEDSCESTDKKWVLLNGNGTKQLNESQGFIIKLTGNQQSYAISIDSQSSKVGGLCVLVAGNHNAIKITSNAGMGRLVYSGLGNQSAGLISFTNPSQAQIDEAQIQLRGNESSLQFSGAAACPVARRTPNAGYVSCD